MTDLGEMTIKIRPDAEGFEQAAEVQLVEAAERLGAKFAQAFVQSVALSLLNTDEVLTDADGKMIGFEAKP